jgi:2,3-diketo-5-methylthio-1-phosphopentane phosphatase
VQLSEPLTLQPGDLVCTDFDGTITSRDTGNELISLLGLEEAWELEHQWRRGEIGSRECLTAQWGMVRMAEEQFHEFLDDLPLDQSFPAFVELCRSRDVPVVILSDGLDLYIYRMLPRLGLCGEPGTIPLREGRGCLPVFTNEGAWTPEGIRVAFPHGGEDCSECGNCKSDEVKALRHGHERVFYLGDGFSDMCAVLHADVVFAKDHLAEFMEDREDSYYPFATFAEVLRVLR